MAKQVKISTSWSVTDDIMAVTVETRPLDASKDAAPTAKFSRSLVLNELFPGYALLTEVGIQAVEFGVFTRIRNSLGSAETFEEAEEAVDRILSAFASGEWGAEREQSTIPFSATHILALAVERATSGAQDAATAATKLGELAEATCAANGMPTFAEHYNNVGLVCRTDILTEMGPGSPARGMKFIPETGPPTIVTCQAGYTAIATGVTTYSDTALEEEGRKIFPGLTPALARSKLIADLPIVANHFHGSSQSAQQIFQQRSLVNAFLQARANLGAADGDTFAVLRAEEQARNTYEPLELQPAV